MADPDLLIRHLPVDGDRAHQLARALARYGYLTELTTSPVEKGRAHLALWSPAAIVDDAFIWECTSFARVDTSGVPAPIYEAIVTPIASRPAIHPYFGGRTAAARVLHVADLSEWDGDPASDQLALLIWLLPPPFTLSPSPPHPRAADWKEARWRWLRARRDLAAMAGWVRDYIAPARSREDVAKLQAEIAEVRKLGADPEAWKRCGPRTVAAAAEGPAALRAWADTLNETCTLPDPHAPDRMHNISAVADLQFAIQLCVGVNKRLTFSLDIRTEEELFAEIEAGNEKTISQTRYDGRLHPRLKTILERLAKANNGAALDVLADYPGTPDYRRRLNREKAARLGNIDAIRALVRHYDQKCKFREAIAFTRQGAELGDRECKERLARVIDAGKNVKRNAEEAYALYQEIVIHEPGWRDPSIALRIAQMQWDGDGCPRDRDAALHAIFDLHIGEEAPYAAGIFIGDLYRDGLHGITQDREEAIGWYRRAMTFGNAERAAARNRLKEMKAELSPEDAEEDDLDEDESERLRTFWRARA